MSIANRINFFEEKSKPAEKPQPEPVRKRKLSYNPKLNCRMILPAGGIPKYIPPNPCKSPKVIKCDQTKSNEPQIDRNSVQANMSKMKSLLEQQDIRNVASFKLKDIHQLHFNFDSGEGDNKSRFAAAKQMFEGGNQANSEAMKIVDNKPVRKDIKKRADIKRTFHE